MRGSDGSHGEDSHEILDFPVVWDERSGSEDDHAYDTDDGEDHGEFELWRGSAVVTNDK